MLSFLDLLVHTSLRDLYVRGTLLDDTVRAAQTHVQRNPFLWDRICARWVLPTWAGSHASKYFVSAPLFLEDRHSSDVIRGLARQMLSDRAALSICASWEAWYLHCGACAATFPEARGGGSPRCTTYR